VKAEASVSAFSLYGHEGDKGKQEGFSAELGDDTW